MNIDYILRTKEGRTAIISNHRRYVTGHSVAYVLNQMLLTKLATLKGRLSATKKLTGWERKIPIYVDCHHVFMVLKGLRSDETLIVNLKNVVSTGKRHDGKAVISFSNGHVLVFASRGVLCRQWKRASAMMKLKDGLENAFMRKTR